MSEKGLPIRCRSLRVPKAGHAQEEYEDAFACAVEKGRFAIADGASESSFAREWAELLTADYIAKTDGRIEWEDWLPPIRERWKRRVSAEPLAWYAEEKVEVGAYATFLALEIYRFGDGPTLRWRAAAVGDSCLFQIRDDQLLMSFPIVDIGEFNTRPALIGSQPRRGNGRLQDTRTAVGSLQPGDLLILATDAIALWFFGEMDAGSRPWQIVSQLDDETFPLWVAQQRESRALKNDDVTIAIVELQPHPEEHT